MHSLFNLSGSPNEVSLGSVREEDILHDMIWHAAKASFSKRSSAAMLR